MKRYFLLLLSSLLTSMSLHAQDVWCEGTRWDIEYLTNEKTVTISFELKGHTVLDDVDYLNLYDLTDDHIIGYVRSERGDTLVYARLCNDSISDELLLYDFSSFEPGSYFHYSSIDSSYNDTIPHVILQTDTITAEGLTYYHDVIAEGDILPCWNNVLFKIGCLDGPMAYLYDALAMFEGAEGTSSKPKRRNVSHTVLQLAGREVKLTPNGIDAIRKSSQPMGECYDLKGIRVCSPQKGVYIINGKKYVR